MEGQNYLGIYLSNDSATVVCIDSRGRGANVLGCFSVSVRGQEEQSPQVLARLIAEGCAERELVFSEAAVALDCSMFMQHNVHSEFKDAKQIAATVRFDTEEALSGDITDTAIAFKITSSDQTGSALAVFTAQRRTLSDILLSLQSNNIDPVTVEPDINCLSRFIVRNVFSTGDSDCLFAILSGRSGYFLAFVKSQEVPAVRTFLTDPSQDRSELLARQIPLTIGLIGEGQPINHLKIFDAADTVSCQQLGEKVGIEASGVDLIESVAVDADVLGDCAGAVDFAVAYGAALAHLDRDQGVNFRNDFMPYQGKKLRLQKALKVMSISVSVLMVALGMYVASQLWRINRDRSQLWSNFRSDYLAVMAGEKEMPTESREVVRKLRSELNRIRSVQKGLLSVTGEESVSAKLVMVLGAFNECAKPTKLKIDRIHIMAKNIRIDGSTSSRKNTRKLLAAIKEKFVIGRDEYGSKGGRDNFSMTLVPKK